MSRSRTFERACDSRGRPVRGLYVRDGRYYAGYSVGGRWSMKALDADTLTEARRERESLTTGIREGRVATRSGVTFGELFAEWQDSRAISNRTRQHEGCILRRYLSDFETKRVQDVTASDVAKLLNGMRDRYSSWTCVHAWRVLSGVFSLACLRGVLDRNPTHGLAKHERPKQRNRRAIARLHADDLERLVLAHPSERWRAALGLAAFAGLRAGEIRALRWQDVDLAANLIRVSHSALPDGEIKAPKSDVGIRAVPLLPVLRRLLVAWRLGSPRTLPDELVISTAEGKPVAPENLRRAMAQARKKAKLDPEDARLSLHSLRHAYGSLLATDFALPATTLAALLGHADAGTSLRIYARDTRDEIAVAKDVLARAASSGVGT